MSQGISFSGLGSGLDTDSIIQQLIDVERRPIRLIQNRQTRLEQQKGVVKSINSSLLTLKGTVGKLESKDLFSIVNATSDNASRVDVEATNEAAAGTFSVEVLALAKARRLSSRSFGSLSSALNFNGEFVVNGKGIEVKAEDSLLSIRDKINSAKAGITAQILTVATGDNRLIVTADQVGKDGFAIQDASSTNLLQGLGFTSSTTSIKNGFANGARSSQFLEEDEAVGTLLGLSSAPSGTIAVGDKEVAIDLAVDSLNAIRDKIEAAAPTGVSVQVSSSVESGLTRFRLEVEGTTSFVDSSGVLETLGVLDSGGQLADKIVTGAESDAFSSTSTAVGSLLGLATGPSATVKIGGQDVAIDLAADSLTDVQTKINNAAPAGVTATVISSADEEGNTLFRLRIDGTDQFEDSGNVLESMGVLVGSNNAFESVAQVLTGNVANQQKGALRHATGDGAKTDGFDSDSDAVGSLIGSSASGTITVGDKTVSIDLAADSLNDIRDKINAAAPTGVTAVVNATGPSTFELSIQGTTSFEDANGVLQALGVVEAPTTLNAETRFADIVGAKVKVGDTITISGTNHEGAQVAGSFTISSSSTKVQGLLTGIEQLFGSNVSATVDASGRIVVKDKLAGSSKLAVSLQANNEGNGSLALGSLSVTTAGVEARSSELQAGEDASLRINGITLSRSGNTITDAVQGVTLNLNEAEEGQLINITVTKDDTKALRENIETFVADFNSAMDLINEQFTVDEATQQGGPLSGDSTLLSLQSRLRSILSSQVSGLTEGFDALVLIGISFDRSGRLNIDDERLTKALNENLEEVRKLFVAQGETSDEKIEFISSNSRTRPGDYAVNISQAAARASVQGAVEFAGTLDADRTLELIDKVTGKAAKVKLLTGMSLDDIVSRVNADLASDVAEVRRGTIANTTDGSSPITSNTAFAQIFGANAQAGDTIRINGTTHEGNNVTSTFTISDPSTSTVGDLLAKVRSTFNGKVSASVDSEGRIVVTDNQVGDSELTVTLIEENEGGGALNFGSIDVEAEGRLSVEVKAENRDGKLFLEHNGFGTRNGFTLNDALEDLGVEAGEFTGIDVQGRINGEEADGFGRILTGKIGADNVDGLSLRVELTDEDLAEGGQERGNVGLVFGVARLLSDALKVITDDFEGTLKTREKAIDDTIKDLDSQIAGMERRIGQKRTNLVNKFAALEGSIATLQSQGNFLSSQLAGLTSRR